MEWANPPARNGAALNRPDPLNSHTGIRIAGGGSIRSRKSQRRHQRLTGTGPAGQNPSGRPDSAPAYAGESEADVGTNDALLPAAQTDTIYSLIVNELGLFGACAVILTYLLITARGFKIALLADDGFSKLLATGLTAVFAIQAFVIIGGVTRVIPLTGVTLPFVSYGGSSIVANFVLLALLLLVSDRARRPAHLR